MAVGVEDGQEDQPCRPGNGEEDADHAEYLLGWAGVAGEAAGVAEVALGEEGKVEEDGCDDVAGYEEGFQAVGAYVGDVGDGLAGFHRWVVRLRDYEPADEHG